MGQRWALVAMVVIGLGAACDSGGATLTGTFVLFDTSGSIGGGESRCFGTGGYSDIDEGAEVAVHDEEGDLIGSSQLDSGEPIEELACEFRFVIEDLPDAKFYSIEVSQRGDVTFSKSELEEQDWKVELSLGDFES